MALTNSGVSFAEVALLAAWAVFVAELVGDRSMYALASLALRFRWWVVLAAFTVANATKMAIAVLLAHAMTHFQSRWTYLVSAIAFFISAILIWEDESAKMKASDEPAGWAKGLVVSFGAFFLTEWADPGQIAAAALVLKFHMSLATWLGGTTGVMLKGVAATVLGLQVRHHLPLRALRILASASCCLMGILAAVQLLSA